MVSNIFILDKNLKTKIALTVNGQNTFFKDIYNLNLSTGTESYEFSTNVEDIDESDYIMFHYKDQYKLFQITEIEQEHSEGKIITSVYGECASLELINDAVRPTIDMTNEERTMNAIEFIQFVLNGSEWQIGKYSKSLLDKSITIDIDKTTQRWSLIQDYMGEFGYEINTRVKYKNGFVKAKLIDVYAEGDLGNKTYKRFEYGRNVKGITKKKDLYDFCTALIIDSNKDIKNTEYGTYKNGTLQPKDGIIKTKKTDFILAPTNNSIYNSGRDYIYGVYDDNNSDSPGEVVDKAIAELKKRSVPHFDYECDTALTYEEYEDISIGDTVYVIDHSFTPIITLEARVGELEISFTDRDDCKCNLTNYKEKKSGISATLTGNVQSIISTYLPITAKNLAAGAVDPDKVSIETYEIIHADSVKASQGVFEELIVGHAVIEELKAKDAEIDNARIENLKATNAAIENLKAKDVEIENARIENLKATNAKIESLETEDANIKNLVAEKATIKDLNAAKADIGELTANVADINTLIAGNAAMDGALILNLTAANTSIENALIKDAMIDTLSASKINTGTLNTNNVIIQSDTGGVSIAKETMQFKDKDNKVRIQIGRDASNNFTFALYDSTGKGQLINENGIQSSDAIKEEIIRNDHIDDKANISGGKINISSLFEEFNKDTNENTLKATKVLLDDKNQNLNVAFNTLSTTVDGISGGRNYQIMSDFSKDVLENWPSYNNSTNSIATSSTGKFPGEKRLKNVGDIAKRVEADSEGKYRYARFHAPTVTLEKETQYTFSCWAYTNGSSKEAYASIYTVYDDDTSPVSKGSTNKITTTGSWQKIEKTFTTDNTTNKYQVRFYNKFTDGATTGTVTTLIYHPTISKGTKALDWTPAVEDLDGRIETNTTNISAAQGEISTLISNTTITRENGEVVQLKEAYNDTVDTVDSHTKTIGSIEKDLEDVTSKQSEFTQDLSGFKTTVSETYATKEGLKSTTSIATQTANKFSWLVKSGTSSSDMVLTDELYKLTTDKAIISAKKIELNGSININSGKFTVDTSGNMTAKSGTFTGTIIASTIQNAASNPTFTIDKNGNIKGASLKSSSGGSNGNFSIDSEGNIEAQNLAVDGEVSSDIVVCKEIRNKAYPKTLTAGCTIYVGDKTNSDGTVTKGDDDNECKNGAYFATLQGAIDSIPKYMNGKTVTIHLKKNTTEDVRFNYFSSGRIIVYLNGKTITGYLSVYCSSASVQVYGGDSSSSTTYGKIRPVTGSAVGSRTVSVGCDRSTYLSLFYIQAYASTNQASSVAADADKVGVAATINGYIYCSNVKIVDVGIGFRTNNGGHIHVAASSGVATKYGFEATTGGAISFSNGSENKHAGGTTAATNKYYNGQIWADGTSFVTDAAPTPDPTPTPTKVKKTKTYTSSSANAIQYYGQSSAKWRSDSKPKVGTWGYGPHTAWWFFGDDFEEMAKKDVYQIDITFTRQQGGIYSGHTMYFYTHDYESQPSTTSPSYWSTCIGSKTAPINTTNTFSITNSTIINKIKSYKGICSIPSSQSNEQYAVFSATMKVKFYYEE